VRGSLPPVRLEITPKPDPGVRAAIRRALGAGGSEPGHPSHASRWRRAGLRYATALPRSRRGATRA
jgi:hypothetical protein